MAVRRVLPVLPWALGLVAASVAITAFGFPAASGGAIGGDVVDGGVVTGGRVTHPTKAPVRPTVEPAGAPAGTR
ncbi:hypothetical protein AB0G02_05865 [Actinosynnema sp. NPDC023658]|uniref:hypothetical protein n=1 Tax=Actinosynnema sp. NPDC023658 TaxID=3155465 RepID=UPI0033F15112